MTKETKQIQKEFRFETVSAYWNYTMNIPEWYDFMEFLPVENWQGYSNPVAVFVKNIPFSDAIKLVEERYKESTERYKKTLDEEFAKRVGNMQLEKTFNDIITRFNLDEYVYYYEDYARNGKDENIEDHITSMRLVTVSLSKTQVSIKWDIEGREYQEQLILCEYGKQLSPKVAYNTKQEAITWSQEYHNARMKKKQEEADNALKLAEERKAKEEADILAKAEEIKNRK